MPLLTALTWADGQTDDRRQKNPRLEASRLSPLWARPCIPHICSLGCLPPSPALSQLALECQEPTESLRGLELSRSESTNLRRGTRELGEGGPEERTRRDIYLRPWKGPQMGTQTRQGQMRPCASSEGKMIITLSLSEPTGVPCEWTGVN